MSRIVLCLLLLGLLGAVSSCSNFLADKEATSDRSTLLSYNADAGELYGQLYHYAATEGNKDAEKQIFEWDTGRPLGSIPQPENTYNVIGNMNEFGLSIAETTFGGIASLQSQDGSIMDYGSLIWTTLQRAKTAVEAIHTLDYLMQTYGYASEGESFSIADGNDVWVMDIIGKGNFEKGSVWVAQKLPSGAICAHANQARIRTFKLDNESTSLYSKDAVSFAKKIGLYPENASDDAFSFSDTYDPVSFSGARFCEARVWNMFGSVMGPDWMSQYEDYASGKNLTNRMPLFVYPPAGTKISTKSLMSMFRSHYEGTSLDMSGQEFHDLGAANANIPYRAHPLTWKASNGKTYLNERPIGTQQTGWNFVAQTRSWMPTSLKGVIWFGVDDSSTTVRLPVYGSALHAPKEYAGVGIQDGVQSPMMTFDQRSAFYAFNLVANWAYTRWSLIFPDVLDKIEAVENDFHLKLADMDEKALTMLTEKGEKATLDAITNFSDNLSTHLIDTWNTLFGNLFVKYRDGYVITANPDIPSACDVANGPYPQEWYDDIVSSTGKHLLVPDDADDEDVHSVDKKFKPVDKLTVLKRR